jgi:hypothetical protein
MDSFFCIDPTEDERIYGANPLEEYRSLVILFKPCIPKQITSENSHLTETECLADLES